MKRTKADVFQELILKVLGKECILEPMEDNNDVQTEGKGEQEEPSVLSDESDR